MSRWIPVRILLDAVQRAPGGDHTAERLRAEQAPVRVPQLPGFGEALDSPALVGLGVGAAVEQLWCEAARARGGGEHEVERRPPLRLEHLLDPAARAQLEPTPVGICGPATGASRRSPRIG